MIPEHEHRPIQICAVCRRRMYAEGEVRHYRTVRSFRIDPAAVLAGIDAGKWGAEVARELGCSRERVRQVYFRERGVNPPHPIRPHMLPCAICSEDYEDGHLAEHCRARGHRLPGKPIAQVTLGPEYQRAREMLLADTPRWVISEDTGISLQAIQTLAQALGLGKSRHPERDAAIQTEIMAGGRARDIAQRYGVSVGLICQQSRIARARALGFQ